MQERDGCRLGGAEERTGMAIYGECISGAAHAVVTISRLNRESCEFALENTGLAMGEALAAGTELALWIGAIGPLPIVAIPKPASAPARRQSRLTARFAQPLEPAILAHFSV